MPPSCDLSEGIFWPVWWAKSAPGSCGAYQAIWIPVVPRGFTIRQSKSEAHGRFVLELSKIGLDGRRRVRPCEGTKGRCIFDSENCCDLSGKRSLPSLTLRCDLPSLAGDAPATPPKILRPPTDGGIAWCGSRAFPEPLPVPPKTNVSGCPGRQAVRGSPPPSAVLIRWGIGPKATGFLGTWAYAMCRGRERPRHIVETRVVAYPEVEPTQAGFTPRLAGRID
jgi:hypothetical protein